MITAEAYLNAVSPSEEFAAHGFHDASLNRVIDAAGISKGSMYYAFDGKEDLYTHVTRIELERLFACVGPFPIPTETDPDTVWSTLEGYYLRLMTTLAASPQLAALIRGWLAASNSVLEQAQQELEQATLPRIQEALAAGQRAGAVRDVLPSGLLIAVVVGIGRAMDSWLVTRQPDAEDLPQRVRALVGMIRGALEPRAGGHAALKPALTGCAAGRHAKPILWRLLRFGRPPSPVW